MPELPEVETVRLGLSNLIIGKTICDVKYDWAKSFPNDANQVTSFVLGSSITAVDRRAKLLLINLSSKYTLAVHLKMTGQLVYDDIKADLRYGAGHPSDSLVHGLPDKTTRVTFSFKSGSKLYFNDMRKFGWVKLLPTVEVDDMEFVKKLGPEPLTSQFDIAALGSTLQKRPKTSIKAALLDQSVVAGLGNIYVDEALHMAKIHPLRAVASLSARERALLCSSIETVIQKGLDSGGSSSKNYVNAQGQKGSYLTFARVYGRGSEPCEVDGTAISKIKVAGRGTHICTTCQVLAPANSTIATTRRMK